MMVLNEEEESQAQHYYDNFYKRDEPVKFTPSILVNKILWTQINNKLKDLEQLVKDQSSLLHMARAKSIYSQYVWNKEYLEIKRRRDEI